MTTGTARAKDIEVLPISSKDARRIVAVLHYSGKHVNNSQVHLGVFLHGKCGGVMQFGPSLDSPSMAGLLKEGKLREVLELNRMAFAEWLPRNSESRALGYALRLLRKTYPHIRAVVSFADGTQCGDGTIYRAAGFLLTDVRKNTSLRRNPVTGEVVQSMAAWCKGEQDFSTWEKLPGFQFRYVFMLRGTAADLTCKVLPFSAIDEAGAGMYRGVARGKQSGAVPVHQTGEGGSNPTPALQQTPPDNGGKVEPPKAPPPPPFVPNPDNGHGAGDGSPGEDFPALGPEPLPAQERVLLFSDDAARWAAKLTATFGEFSAHPAEWMRALEDPAVAEVWAAELAKAPPGPNHNGRAITVPAEYADRVGMALATGRSLIGDNAATDAEVFCWLLGM